jgi:hypothetical protein
VILTKAGLKEIKIEPGLGLSDFNSKLQKRKAERVSAEQSASHKQRFENNLSDLESRSDCSNGNAFPSSSSSAQLSVLQAKIASCAASSTTNQSPKQKSFPNNSRQQFTSVEYKVYYIEGTNGRIPACITICNIYGMKDILLGIDRLSNGDKFYWPAKMVYDTHVTDMMSNNSLQKDQAEFLCHPLRKPLIVLSFLNGTEDFTRFMSFEEVNTYTKLLIDNATDPSSNTVPKKQFKLITDERNLTDRELDALLVVSKRIGAICANIQM